VSRGARRSNRVLPCTCLKSTIQPNLLSVASKGGGNPWLDTGAPCEIQELPRGGLELRDERTQVS
jgi:hypothetical protein